MGIEANSMEEKGEDSHGGMGSQKGHRKQRTIIIDDGRWATQAFD